MKCTNCQEELAETDLHCPSCNQITARTREDLQKIDPRLNKAIAWSLIAMGLLGLVFVISNSWTDWYSGLDYVAPISLLIVGSIALFSINRK
ncbi:MAG: hypothetical protein RLZZ41_288 [Actinomycetota bacterium]